LTEIEVTEDSPYFDGHFPGFKILPAVAQVDIVLKAAAREFGGVFENDAAVAEIRRAKFSNFVRPGTKLIADLHYDKEKRSLSFKLRDKYAISVYSSGTLIVKDA
jgi:3-hydroxymyristoyl/3-hydroxydecanoyl-(acyl carrier protein) dehydratase